MLVTQQVPPSDVGFHRKVTTTVTIPEELLGGGTWGGAASPPSEVFLLFTLPAGVYIDPGTPDLTAEATTATATPTGKTPPSSVPLPGMVSLPVSQHPIPIEPPSYLVPPPYTTTGPSALYELGVTLPVAFPPSSSPAKKQPPRTMVIVLTMTYHLRYPSPTPSGGRGAVSLPPVKGALLLLHGGEEGLAACGQEGKATTPPEADRGGRPPELDDDGDAGETLGRCPPSPGKARRSAWGNVAFASGGETATVLSGQPAGCEGDLHLVRGLACAGSLASAWFMVAAMRKL